LVQKEFLQRAYRKLAALLRDCGDLMAMIELKAVQHFTTFQKAADRLLLSTSARRLLGETPATAQRLIGSAPRA
jgi:hypothetical protein